MLKIPYGDLLVVLVFSILLSDVYSDAECGCFAGHTEYCVFQCHCSEDYTCDLRTGRCLSGCDSNTAGLIPWSGAGCQIGNVAQSEGASATKSGTGGNASLVIDGSIARGGNNCDNIVQISDGTKAYWRLNLTETYVVLGIVTYIDQSYWRNFPNVSVYVSDTLCGTYTNINGTASDNIGHELQCGTGMVGNSIKFEQGTDKPFRLCEVIVKGYKYVECESYNNTYFYGPACIHKCICKEQCDFITGVCSECEDDDSTSSGSDMCSGGSGDSESYPLECISVCNCKELCDNMTGECHTCDPRKPGGYDYSTQCNPS